MNPPQLERMKTQAAHGFSVGDIASINRCTRAEVKAAVAGSELVNAKRQLLRRVPSWWRGTESEYVRCVFANSIAGACPRRPATWNACTAPFARGTAITWCSTARRTTPSSIGAASS